jgi:hypothetical protein
MNLEIKSPSRVMNLMPCNTSPREGTIAIHISIRVPGSLAKTASRQTETLSLPFSSPSYCNRAWQVCYHEPQMHFDICFLVRVDSACFRPIDFLRMLLQRLYRPDAVYSRVGGAVIIDQLAGILVAAASQVECYLSDQARFGEIGAKLKCVQESLDVVVEAQANFAVNREPRSVRDCADHA